MAENKKIILDWGTTGLTVYGIIRRESDGFLMNDADGSFAATPVDPYISLTENATIKGRYELDEARTVWTDGLYTVAIYNQAGGAPAPVSDTIIGTGPAFWAIKDDVEVFLSAPAALETTLDAHETSRASMQVSLESGQSAILAQVTGTGNRAITIHVQDALAADIADVLVRIGTASAYTDSGGDAVFALDDGAYSVYLRKDFVTFTVPEALTVAGDGTQNYTGTVFAPAVPTAPNTCVVYGIVTDNGPNVVEGTKIFINTVSPDTFAGENKIVKNQETTSIADGTWQLELIRNSELAPNESYQVIMCDTSFKYETTITVPDAVSVEFSTIKGT
jgi:hypothetical protein